MADGILPGLIKGLATTAKSLTRHAHTAEYPDVSPALPPRSRGVIALTEENCTSCMLCARECPDWCIYIDSHKEELPPTTPGGRARQRNVLDRFAIDFSLCMYCSICIEVCPFDALHWSPEFEYAETDIRDLLHEKDRLGAWMATVPPPSALDAGSADPAEVAAAAKPPRGSGAGAAGSAPRPARVRPAGAAPATRPVGAVPTARAAAAAATRSREDEADRGDDASGVGGAERTGVPEPTVRDDRDDRDDHADGAEAGPPPARPRRVVDPTRVLPIVRPGSPSHLPSDPPTDAPSDPGEGRE
ncbi:NADH-quinone oxidoreductase subunit I [Humibacillus sp. DSM 29435]|uniref:NuoI/complex I 23 kDa subunit family protein n=1 Tax=Humibacillus sp. DSM 29435 TaxID=1869167 RepID=UPI000AFC2DB8|nr:NADH-quinone oxidoreductase subunit I [Humibacillus sp. DSM 29435]